MNETEVIAVIPARYASSRLPGKPLRDVAGKPLVQRVVEQLYLVDSIAKIIVATDDERILDLCQSLEGAEGVMTSDTHRSGTDRCAEVASGYGEDSIIMNVQGDEPFLSPDDLEELIDFYRETYWDIATLGIALDASLAEDPHTVKTVFDRSGRALYFSRVPIPYFRDGESEKWYYKHLGVYIFRNRVLQDLSELPVTRLEQAEKLEQLRWMEHGYAIGVLLGEQDSIGIDTEDDILRAEEKLKRS